MKIFISSLLILLLTSEAYTQGYNCKKCDPWKIAVFDIDVQIPEPTDLAEKNKWKVLHKFSGSFMNALYATEDRHCMYFLDNTSHSVINSGGNGKRGNQGMSGMDYIIEGSITGGTGTYKYNSTAKLIRAVDGVVIRTAFYPFSNEEDHAFKANMLKLALGEIAGTGGHQGPIKNVIYEFEKKLRDDPKANCAWKPEIVPEKYEYTVDPLSAKTITYTLKDCDDVPLTGRIVKVIADKELNTYPEAHAVKDGVIKVSFVTPEKEGTYTIRIEYDYKKPNQQPNTASQNITIKVKKPKTEFNAILEVKTITISKQFDNDGILNSKTETENNYSVNQVLTFNDVLFERLEKKLQNLDYCNSKGGCVLLQGNNNLFKPTAAEPIGTKNSPVRYSFTSKDYSICEGSKLILTRSSEGNGSTSEYMVTDMITIYKYNKADEDFKPLPLVKNKADMDDISPLPLTNATHFAQLSFWLGYFNPSPGNSSLKRYDCTTKKWENSDEKSGGPSGGWGDREKSRNENGFISYYVNPVIPEIELMNYLRNPVGLKRFNINARAYRKEADTESQTDYYITLTLF